MQNAKCKIIGLNYTHKNGHSIKCKHTDSPPKKDSQKM